MASPTTWYPRARQSGRKWVLTDGSVIESPVLEESGSGRRVRLQGSLKSHPSGNADMVVHSGTIGIAYRCKQRILTEFHSTPDGAHPMFHDQREKPEAATLHLLDNPSTQNWQPTGKTTKHWWLFKCAEIPQIQMLVQIVVNDVGSTYDRKNGSVRKVTTVMYTPLMLPSSGAVPNAEGRADHHPPHGGIDQEFKQVGRVTGSEDRVLRDWMDHTDWPARHGELSENVDDFWQFVDDEDDRTFKNDDKGVLRELLRRTRTWHGVDAIAVPNFAKIAFPELASVKAQPKAWSLRLAETNVTNDVIDSLMAVIEGHDSVSEALEHFAAMQKALRSAGLVLQDVRGADILRLLGEQSKMLTTPVSAAIYDADNQTKVEQADGHRDRLPFDDSHRLSVDLVSGNFVLNCTRRALDSATMLDKAAESWEQARAMASITGEEDELLAYARAFAAQQQAVTHDAVLRATH